MDTWTNEDEKEICIDRSLAFELRPFLHLFMDRKTNRFSGKKKNIHFVRNDKNCWLHP